MTLTIVLEHVPVAWSSHKGYGRRSYSSHTKEKERIQAYLKYKFPGFSPFQGPVRLDAVFFMPIPQSSPSKLRKAIKNGIPVYHHLRKDRTNLLKFYEDCLTGIIYVDDGQVCAGEVQKLYAEKPSVLLIVQQLEDLCH